MEERLAKEIELERRKTEVPGIRVTNKLWYY